MKQTKPYQITNIYQEQGPSLQEIITPFLLRYYQDYLLNKHH